MKKVNENSFIVRINSSNEESYLLLCNFFTKAEHRFCIIKLVSCSFVDFNLEKLTLNSIKYDLWAYNEAHRIVDEEGDKEWIIKRLKNEFEGEIKIIEN